jgi:hypothetical protein
VIVGHEGVPDIDAHSLVGLALVFNLG